MKNILVLHRLETGVSPSSLSDIMLFTETRGKLAACLLCRRPPSLLSAFLQGASTSSSPSHVVIPHIGICTRHPLYLSRNAPSACLGWLPLGPIMTGILAAAATCRFQTSNGSDLQTRIMDRAADGRFLPKEASSALTNCRGLTSTRQQLREEERRPRRRPQQ